MANYTMAPLLHRMSYFCNMFRTVGDIHILVHLWCSIWLLVFHSCNNDTSFCWLQPNCNVPPPFVVPKLWCIHILRLYFESIHVCMVGIFLVDFVWLMRLFSGCLFVLDFGSPQP